MELRSTASLLALTLGASLATTIGCGSSSKGTQGTAGSSSATSGSSSSGSTTTASSSSSSGAGGAGTGGTSATGGSTPAGPTIGGCPLFPPDYPYDVDISAAPVDPGSATYIANLEARAGAIVAEYPGGYVYNVVPQGQASVPVQTSGAFGFDTSDKFYATNGMGATAPIPSGVVYENMTTPNADHHMIVIQQGSCRLFELYSWNPSNATTGWEALVTWNLTKNEQLPDGYGSTTAAGTPLLAGVIWYDEVMSGSIEHAVDIQIPGAAIAQYTYVKPAARSGGACGSKYPADGFPYGGRLRLKASYDTSSYTGKQALVVIAALKKYGMINTDNSGESRSSFRLGDGTKLDQNDIAQLAKLTWNDFEVPTMDVVMSKACN